MTSIKDSRYVYKVVNFNLRVIDGDTIDCNVDVGFKITNFHRFRLLGYDAPETFRPSSESERQKGILVKEKLNELCALALADKALYVKSIGNADVYGRYLGEFYCSSDTETYSINERINEYMISNNLLK